MAQLAGGDASELLGAAHLQLSLLFQSWLVNKQPLLSRL